MRVNFCDGAGNCLDRKTTKVLQNMNAVSPVKVHFADDRWCEADSFVSGYTIRKGGIRVNILVQERRRFKDDYVLGVELAEEAV